MALTGAEAHDPHKFEGHSMSSDTDTAVFDLSADWRAMRGRVDAVWRRLPPVWRSERRLLAVAAVVALALLAAFHQVVDAGVDRAARRDATAHRQQAVVALCGIERDAHQRALCLLTRPTAARAETRLAAVR